MGFPEIPLLQIDDYKLNQLQKNIAQAVNQISKLPFTTGIAITDQPLTTGVVNSVAHRLQKNYTGYFITKLNANSVIWVANSDQPALFLNLNCSANCTVDLWVY